MTIPFSKYQGTGNDFIIIDNRNHHYNLTQPQIEKLCHRRFGIGADGLMLLETHAGYDFNMRYYNADGFEGSMCGNGGRCLVNFAYEKGIIKEKYLFLAIDGDHEAARELNGTIRLKMKDVQQVESHLAYVFLDTGSPHVVKQIPELENYAVVEEGRNIRNHPTYREKGVNVNFVQVLSDCKIFVRTYERGVEDETLSCGTGVTASALVHAHNALGYNHVEVKTTGGTLYVEFYRTGEGSFENIWLAGPAQKVFDGSFLL